MDNEPMLSMAELADYLGKSRQCLYQWRARGVFPFHVYGSGRKLRVDRREVDDYVQVHGAVPGKPSRARQAQSAPSPAAARPTHPDPGVVRRGRILEVPLDASVTLKDAGELVRRIQEGSELAVVLGETGCSLRITDP